MTRYDLSTGLPADLAAMPALYLLGVGGPEDASGIGNVDAFVWRFVAIEAAGDQHRAGGPAALDRTTGGEGGGRYGDHAGAAGRASPPVILAFSAMPKLMQFTRAVNGRAPFTVPTEALRVAARDLAGGVPAVVVLDPSAADFDALRARGRLVERRIAALEGGSGT